MAKSVDKDEIIYSVSLDPYKAAINTENCKKVFINDKQVGLSVGGHLDMSDELKTTLLIDVHYDSDNTETLTVPIPQLESYDNRIAINPEFKNKEVIDKLTELNIISKPIETVKYKNKDYNLVTVNFDEFMLYEPFGNSILNDFKGIERYREKQKEKEL